MGGAKPQFTKVVIAQLLEKIPNHDGTRFRFTPDSPLEGDGFGLRSPATGTMVFVRALGPGSFANKTDGPKCLSLPHRIYLARAA